MKKVLLGLVLLLGFNGISQTKTDRISGIRCGKLFCVNEMEIDLSNSDTTYIVYCQFQNIQYQVLTDMGSIGIYSKSILDKTINNLKECLKYMDDKSLSFRVGEFNISKSSKNLFVYDGDKFTFLNKKNVIKFINYLEKCVMK